LSTPLSSTALATALATTATILLIVIALLLVIASKDSPNKVLTARSIIKLFNNCVKCRLAL
jgi:hypothetical protein